MNNTPTSLEKLKNDIETYQSSKPFFEKKLETLKNMENETLSNEIKIEEFYFKTLEEAEILEKIIKSLRQKIKKITKENGQMEENIPEEINSIISQASPVKLVKTIGREKMKRSHPDKNSQCINPIRRIYYGGKGSSHNYRDHN